MTKKTKILFATTIVFIIALFLFNEYLNESEIDHFENFLKVEIGMNESEVEQLIGQPDRIKRNDAPLASYVYKYSILEGYSGIFELAIDSTLSVVDISNTVRKNE